MILGTWTGLGIDGAEGLGSMEIITISNLK